MSTVIWYVIPCYNEEEVIDETVRRLQSLLDGLIEEEKISQKSKILFVDDGSTDSTWEKLTSFSKADKRIWVFVRVKITHFHCSPKLLPAPSLLPHPTTIREDRCLCSQKRADPKVPTFLRQM